MPRKPRLHYPGALYHVIARGNNRQATFLDEIDYTAFLALLSRVLKKKPFVLHAYCLMPNHFHLLVEVEGVPLSHIMQRLLTAYSHYFNRTHRRGGHLFQGRYKAILCEKDAYLLELVRYIHLNPVRAGLVSSPAEWKWSGHEAFLKGVSSFVTVEPVLAMMGTNYAAARRAYTQFVRDGLAMGHREDFYPEEKVPYLGRESFIVQNRIRHEERIVAHRPDRSETRSLKSVLDSFCQAQGTSSRALVGPSRIGPVAAARRAFIRQAFDEGHPPARIARVVGRSQAFIAKTLNQN